MIDIYLVYACEIGLILISREIDFEKVLAYELAATTNVQFRGEIKIVKSKSVPKQKIKPHFQTQLF